MENFVCFLKTSKSLLKNLCSHGKTIHITLGNESCDLDSTISSLLLSYFLSKRNPESVVIPVMNVTQENFLLRSENLYVLKEAGISYNNLVFRNEVNFQNVLNKTTVTASLVDHHVLSKNDEILANYVTQIFDHRPVDPSYKWDSKKVSVRIEQVGSCATLIADEILKNSEYILNKPLAYLLYQTIIYDTIALTPENGKAKPLDIEIGTKLEQTFNFTKNRQVLFDELWAAHNDVSHLTAKQLLYKDLKVVEGVFVPGLPMLVEDYLKLEGSYEAVVDFSSENKVSSVLLVGLDVTSTNVSRDLAIFSIKNDKFKNSLLNIFYTNKEYDFHFEKKSTKYDDIVLLQHNKTISRKQLVPLIKLAILASKD